jgi:hypothetical protein
MAEKIFAIDMRICVVLPRDGQLIAFFARITYLDDRRAEYRGNGHEGGFALDSPMAGKMTVSGGILPVWATDPV